MEGDKDEERCVVPSPDARVNPGAVMIIPLDAPLADIAVVAARYGDDAALETELVHFEALEKLAHGHV